MTRSRDSDDSPAWYCVRTQSKREHIAATNLRQLEAVQAFCPRLRYRKATRRGKVWWVEAMFPGYIFAFFSRRQYERLVVHTPGVMKLLKFGDYVPEIQASFVADLIRRMQEQDADESDTLTLRPTVKEGDEVEIAHGSMRGIQGKVVEVLPSSERVKLLIEFLGGDHIVDADIFSLLLPNKSLPD